MALSQPRKDPLIFQGQQSQNANDKKISLLTSKNPQFIWSDRLLFIKDQNNGPDEKFWNFTAFDLLMNETVPIRFRKTAKEIEDVDIIPMGKEFGAIFEKPDNARYIRFIKIDWGLNECQLIRRIKFECQCLNIIVDKFKPSKFVLKWRNHTDWTYKYQICKLTNGKIKFGKVHKFEGNFNVYSNEKFINVEIGYPVKIKVFDINTEEETTFEIDAHLLLKIAYLFYAHEWVNDNLYVVVKSKDLVNFGIIRTDLQTKNWTVLNFKSDLCIQNLQFLNGNLVVFARDDFWGDEYNETGYSTVPVRRPNHLRKSAWLLTVEIMKNKREKDPYKSAKEFLPLNSDLREAWFKDEEL